MTTLLERQNLVSYIQEAMQAGARLFKACSVAGISLRTYRRWYRDGQVQCDERPTVQRPVPSNKLSDQEREHIVNTCNTSAYKSLPPSQIVPALLDQCVYLASESTFYRVFKQYGMNN